jgi:carboxylate-amine ligase
MSSTDLSHAFAAAAPLTVGIEEELMLLDAATLDLAPRAPELLAAIGGDQRYKLEMPAAQFELLTPPCASVPEAAAHVDRARADLAEVAARLGLRVAAAGVHPFAAPLGELNPGERYDATHAEYGEVARCQLVFGLHVHVAVGGAEATIAVHDALRSHLPELAALAAAGPFYAGRDTGLASVRPEISGLLPRQGVPPVLGSMGAFAEALDWGARAGGVPQPRSWWWELRPHAGYGTLEVRVCDSQPAAHHTAALAGVIHALVADLAARHGAGESPAVAETWRIEENRWSACRHGLEGEMADLVTGAREPTAVRVGRLLDRLAPAADRVGCAAELGLARALLEQGGAARWMRERGRAEGAAGLAGALAAAFARAGTPIRRSGD